MTDAAIAAEAQRRADDAWGLLKGPDFEGIKRDVAAMFGRTPDEVGSIWREDIVSGGLTG